MTRLRRRAAINKHGGGGSVPGSMFFSDADIAAAPASGTAYNDAVSLANGTIGTVDLSSQDSQTGSYCYAAALMYRKFGTQSYKDKVVAAVSQCPGQTIEPRAADGSRGGVLAVARQLAGWVISADLVNYRDSAFVSFCDSIRTRALGGHYWGDIQFTTRNTANNWGTHALCARAACSAYLGDTTDLDEVANIFRRYTGQDRAAWTQWEDTADHDPTWVDFTPYAGINGTTVAGMAGAVVEDICRSTGSYPTIDITGLGYTWEALQGCMVTARILRQTGRYGDPFTWGNNALRRAAEFVWQYRNTAPYNSSPYGAYPPWHEVSQWVPYAINKIYGINLTPLGNYQTSLGFYISVPHWIW